jgi:hypothetical protein
MNSKTCINRKGAGSRQSTRCERPPLPPRTHDRGEEHTNPDQGRYVEKRDSVGECLKEPGSEQGDDHM